MLWCDFPFSPRMLWGRSPIAGRKIHENSGGLTLPWLYDWKEPPLNFVLHFCWKGLPEEEKALLNAPIYVWRSQCPPEIEKAKNSPSPWISRCKTRVCLRSILGIFNHSTNKWASHLPLAEPWTPPARCSWRSPCARSGCKPQEIRSWSSCPPR